MFFFVAQLKMSSTFGLGSSSFSQKHLRCLGSRLVVETAWERYARDESADGTVMLPCYVWSCWGAAAAGRETCGENAWTLLLPWYVELLGLIGYCSHAICSCWG